MDVKRRIIGSLALFAVGVISFGNGCSSSIFSTNPCPLASAPLICPNGFCCPNGSPYECNGKCSPTADACGGTYTFCGSGSGGSAGNTALDGGGCPQGTVPCGASYCSVDGTVCCASAGHPEVSCSAGATCNADGTCSGGSSSGSSGTSGSSSGSGTGVPCSTNAHPAWESNECVGVATCSCTLKSCTRIANGGCCQGYDLGFIFIPCDGSGGTSCGDCTNAAKEALQQCGCAAQ